MLAALELLAGLNRSGKRGDAAGEVNACYGHDPGAGFYTHVSDQHGPCSVRVMSATHHEAPYVLDGLTHHGTGLRIGTHYTDTGGASDHVFIHCAMLGFRLCPRLRDLPDRKLANLRWFHPLVDRDVAARAMVTSHVYAGGRHEILNEIDRDEVTAALIDWINTVVLVNGADSHAELIGKQRFDVSSN